MSWRSSRSIIVWLVASGLTTAAEPPPIRVEIASARRAQRLIVRGNDGAHHLVTLAQPQLDLPAGNWRLQINERPAFALAAALEVTRTHDRLRIIALVPRESYVARAVSAETVPGTPAAALAAQAIVARSYALAPPGRHGAAAVCDLAHCQLLRWCQPVRAEAVAAAHQTAGQLLVRRNGTTARAVFHAACGGETADPRDLFGGDDDTGALPVRDGCPSEPWTAEIAREIAQRSAPAPLAQLEFVRDRSGRLLRLIDPRSGRWLSADAWARTLDRASGWRAVRSTRFVWEDRGRYLALAGNGVGHGVGLCQRGAARWARDGAAAAAILAHYFPRSRLVAAPAFERVVAGGVAHPHEAQSLRRSHRAGGTNPRLGQ